MKKLLVSLIILIIAVLTTTAAAHSTTYVFQPKYPNLNNLYYRSYYTWGINLNSPLTGKIVSASMFVDSIYNVNPYGYPDDLRVHSSNDAAGNVGPNYRDGDFFRGQDELNSHGHGLSDKPLHIDHELTTEEIDLLNDNAVDLNFGSGFEPDCCFRRKGISLALVAAGGAKPGTWLVLAIGSMTVAVIEITRLVRYVRRSDQE